MALRKYELAPEQLRKNVSRSFVSSLNPSSGLESIIGQERAVSALEFGAKINAHGYNIYVSGEHGLGKHSIVERLLKQYAGQQPAPNDQLLVHNFEEPELPYTLELLAGEGKSFKKDFESVHKEIASAFNSMAKAHSFIIRSEIEAVEKEYSVKFEAVLSKHGLTAEYIRDEDGNIIEVSTGLKDSQGLNKEQQTEILKNKIMEKEIADAYVEFMQGINALLLAANMKKAGLEQKASELKAKIIDISIKHLSDKYGETTTEYLGKVCNYLKSHLEEIGKTPDDPKYLVNLVVDNSENKNAPVIFEKEPTLENLIGCVDSKGIGRKKACHMDVKAGSLIKANGGYLIIDAMDLLKDARAFYKLLQALKNGEAGIVGSAGFFGPSVKTKPFKTDTKVVLVGEAWLRYLLQENIPEFSDLFKVHSEFASVMHYDSNSVKQYADFVANITVKEKLLPIAPDGICAVIESSLRKCENKDRLSTNFGYVADVVREANHWAKQRSSSSIEYKDVEKAVAERAYRNGRMPDAFCDYIKEGIINIKTKGEIIGQVNGLCVYDLGDCTFGVPSRITASTSAGENVIVNIEKEAELGGEIYNKSVHILEGRLRGRYAQDKLLALHASICFEQSYGGIDGDSATLAMLCSMYSSLSGLGINQAIAITGSADQHGNAQAIGGVNEKIEGWYKTCREKGFNSEHGVIIPKANINDLMLPKEIVEACAAGKFHIYAVSTDTEAAEILMGRNMCVIDDKINEKLAKYNACLNVE